MTDKSDNYTNERFDSDSHLRTSEEVTKNELSPPQFEAPQLT